MYGFIYNTLRDLILKNYGEEKWFIICNEAAVTELKDKGLDKYYYDEAYLNRLVDAARKVLSLPKEVVLESFGCHFFETIKISGHSTMLRSLGHNLYGFLMNLDALHDHLSFTYNQMQAPSFRCEKTKSAIILHYNSQREGLNFIVSGIVKSVARQFFSLEVDVKVTKYEKLPQRLCHHYIFQVSLKDGDRDEIALERLKGKMSVSDMGYDMREQSFSPPMEDTDTEMSFEPSRIFLSQPRIVLSPPAQTEGSGCPFSNALAAPANNAQSNRSNSTGQMITIDPPENEDTLTEDGRELAQLRQRLTLAFGDRGVVYEQRLPNSILPELPINRMLSRRGSTMSISWPITIQFFQNTFPFHIIFDKELVIRYMGVSLARLFPNAVRSGDLLTEYFELSRPAVKLTYLNIKASLQNVFVMRTKETVQLGKKDVKKDPLYFRGQMIMTSGKDMVVFVASPRIKKVEDLEVQGLYLSDIPVHDVTRDLILLSRHLEAELQLSAELEEMKRALEIEKKRVEEEKKRADQLLYSMLPQTIAEQLKSDEHTSATHHTSVSILFSDIKGFTTICNKCGPMEVVGMLNKLYTKFDSLLEKHGVYKVETIGDAYMVAAGLQNASLSHAEAVTNMAFDMRTCASEVMEPDSNKLLQIRVGIHTGDVVAGVVGTKMPRYCLFGDTVNMASRMESHGEAGYVHISEATFNQLQKEKAEKKTSTHFIFYSRGKIYVKGLSERKRTYFVEPAPEGSMGSTQILVIPEAPERISTVLSIPAHMHSSLSSLPSESNILRSPSFVSDKECKIVKQPSTSKSSLTRFVSATSSVFTDDNEIGDSRPPEFIKPTKKTRSSAASVTLAPPNKEVRTRSVSLEQSHPFVPKGPASERPTIKPVFEVADKNDEVFVQPHSTIDSSSQPAKDTNSITMPHDRSTTPESPLSNVVTFTTQVQEHSQPETADTKKLSSLQKQPQTQKSSTSQTGASIQPHTSEVTKTSASESRPTIKPAVADENEKVTTPVNVHTPGTNRVAPTNTSGNIFVTQTSATDNEPGKRDASGGKELSLTEQPQGDVPRKKNSKRHRPKRKKCIVS